MREGGRGGEGVGIVGRERVSDGGGRGERTRFVTQGVEEEERQTKEISGRKTVIWVY